MAATSCQKETSNSAPTPKADQVKTNPVAATLWSECVAGSLTACDIFLQAANQPGWNLQTDAELLLCGAQGVSAVCEAVRTGAGCERGLWSACDDSSEDIAAWASQQCDADTSDFACWIGFLIASDGATREKLKANLVARADQSVAARVLSRDLSEDESETLEEMCEKGDWVVCGWIGRREQFEGGLSRQLRN